MEQKNCSKKGQKYTHLKESERYRIEAMLADKKSPETIAKALKRGRSTIYREITRGSRLRQDYELNDLWQYRADVAQKDYVQQSKNKGRDLKIGKDSALEEHIRDKILKDKYSPDAIIGEIKTTGHTFKGMICTKTLYRYIDRGFLHGISNENLWQKRLRKKRGYKKLRRISLTNRLGKSIEQRPEKVNQRFEYGHWEGDSLKGPRGSTSGVFTLTERKSLEQIALKLDRCTQECVCEAINDLERQYGKHFRLKFKSITFDNGLEFVDWESLELSVLKTGQQRTVIYFAHAFSAWERGSNENQNRMIRRFIRKGTDLHHIDQKQLDDILQWMNNYPRKRLGYKTANQVAKENWQINRTNGA